MRFKRKPDISKEEIGRIKCEIEKKYNNKELLKDSKEINRSKKNETPIISIITPYHNGQDYIEETAKSILNQTFTNFEWIIVDDCSSKEGIEKLKKIEILDDRIKVISTSFTKKEFVVNEEYIDGCKNAISQNSLGPARTRDLGIEKSAQSAKYIVFLDADDLYDKTFLECCFWTLETHPNASWTYTDSVNFGARNFLWRKWYDVERELKENILLVSACIRKKDLLEVGCFGIQEKKVYEDWYLWVKLIKAGKYPIRMSSLLTYYRQKKEVGELKASNNSNRKRALKIIEEAKRDIVYYKDGIQYPKYDYNWEDVENDKFERLYEQESTELKIESRENSIDKSHRSKKINVLMIFPWMVTGGADRFNLNLVKKMDKRKFSFTIVTTLPSTNEWRRQFEKYATVYDLTTFLDMKDWTSFINYIINKNNIKLIFNSNSEFGYKILPYLKAKHPQIPICDFVHMEEWYIRNGGFSRDSSSVYSVIDKTFTCNENSRKVLIDSFERKPEEIKTIYVGVDEKKFAPEIFDKKELIKKFKYGDILKNKIIISYVCRIADQKRPYLFFEVIKKLVEIRNDFVAIVAGDGPMLDGLRKRVKKHRLENFFVFVGKAKKIERIYAISDLSINTSIKEGLALTSYESLAMGVPVVSSDVGGQKELITDEVGVIVPCIQDEKEIWNFEYSKEEILNYVVAIQKIINNLKFYKANCRKRILKQFTISLMIKNMEKEFISLVLNPNKEKIENGEQLSKNTNLLKELISSYLVSYKRQYEWLCEEFNDKNIHRLIFRKSAISKRQYYEHTLEYKLKHPIVVALRKIGIYEDAKRLLGI